MGTKLINLTLFLTALIAMSVIHFLDKKLSVNTITALTVIDIVIVVYLIFQMAKDVVVSIKKNKDTA